MRVEDLTYRFEVLLASERWVPYTAAALNVDEDDVDIEYATDGRDMIGIWQEPLEFARDELDQALAAFTPELPGLKGFRGLRVLVWEGHTTAGEPVVVLRATDEQLALGRLRRAAAEVQYALNLVDQARSRLRAQVIESNTVDRLGRNQIAREIERTWSRRLVLQFLGGHDLIRDVRRALPASWSHHHPHSYDEFEVYREPWERLLGPFWCGPVQLELTVSGQVELRITDSEEPQWSDQVTVEEEDAYQARMDQRVAAAAEVVVEALTRHGLQLRTKDDQVAEPAAVAAGTVFVVRPRRDGVRGRIMSAAATGVDLDL